MSQGKKVAALYCQVNSIYKLFDCADVYDIERDARSFQYNMPVIAHPPCRAWGRLRKWAKPRPDERDLAFHALGAVRFCGGILEHPAGSELWRVACLPKPGQRDGYGGYTLPVHQSQFGHRAEKKTLLYIVGIEPRDLPPIPLGNGYPSAKIGVSRRISGMPEVSKSEREATPVEFASWLLSVALAIACASK